MNFDTPIEDVVAGAPISASKQNEIIDSLNDIRRIYSDNFVDGLTATIKNRPPVVQFHITQAPAAVTTVNNSSGMYAICRAWDGKQERANDTAIYLLQSHVKGDVIYAYAPAFGTSQQRPDPKDSTKNIPLIWQEVGGGGGGKVPVGEFAYQIYTTVAQNQPGFRMDRYGPLIPNA